MKAKFLFYASKEHIDDENIILTDQEVHHIVNVLRYTVGDVLHVTNGDGSFFETRISSISRKQVVAHIERKQVIAKESNPILAVGLLKNRTRLEWLIEKSVELGVEKVILFQSERSERPKVNLDRLEATAVSAMKQSLRGWLPKIEIFSSLQEVVKDAESHPIVIAHEKFDTSSKITESGLQSMSQRSPYLLIGPEGGFSDQEIEHLLAYPQTHKVSLGNYRLRTETAAIKMLSIFS